jgi:hypothetical protein
MVTEGPAEVLHGRRVERGALERLCVPLLDRLDRLPAPQQHALGVAFGLRAGDAPDRFLVGLAVLSLLAEVAEERPLLCVVDDAQWLDRASAQALVFVARRLLAESVALMLVTRDPSDELKGLPKLPVEGLRNGDARALLGSVLGVPLDERVRERLVAETRGNPLALLELPRGLTPAELAGGFGLLDAPGLSGRIEDSFRRRLAGLSADTQRLLLVAAAEPVGDPVLVWQAAGRLGIGLKAAADTDGLLAIGTRVTFRHPLVRSSVYRAASASERQTVHRALAEATDPEMDPDRRAWHRAQAAFEPDEEVAAELERSAGRAQARGGLAAAAAFLERAAGLTVEPARRCERALAAAQAKYKAGAFDAALGLVGIAESGPLDGLRRAQVDVLRAQIAFAASHGDDAPPLLLKAARRLELLDVSLARETYLDALDAATFAGRLAKGGGPLEVAEAIRAAPHSRKPPRAPDLLLDGFAVLITDGHRAAAPILRKALSAFRSDEVSSEESLRWLWLAYTAAGLLWDYESWDALSARFVQLARDAGALTVLPLALTTRAGAHLFAGEGTMAASLAHEVLAVNEAIGTNLGPYPVLTVFAFQGREAEASELIEVATKNVAGRGEGRALTFICWATAVLHNGPRSLRRRGGGGRAGQRGFKRGVVPQLGIRRADRGGHPLREDPARGRHARPALRDHHGQWQRLGARRRGPLAGPAEPRRRRRNVLSAGDRGSRADPRPGGARPRPSLVRRMAAPREPTSRRPRAATHRAHAIHGVRHARVRRACASRARGNRRACTQTERRDAR